MTRTPEEAAAWLADMSARDVEVPYGTCLIQQRTAYDVDPKYLTAWKSAVAAGDLSATAPPFGAELYWSGGAYDPRFPEGAGHIAFSMGDGSCWSTDFKRSNHIDRVLISDINRGWTRLTYRGWSHIVNDVIVLGEDQQQGGDHQEVPDPPTEPPPTSEEDDMLVILRRSDDKTDGARWLLSAGKRIYLAGGWADAVQPLIDAGVPTIAIADTALQDLPEVR